MDISHLTEFSPNRRSFLKQGIALGALAGLDHLQASSRGLLRLPLARLLKFPRGKFAERPMMESLRSRGFPTELRPPARCALCLPQNRRPGQASATVSDLGINHRKTRATLRCLLLRPPEQRRATTRIVYL